MCGKRRYSYHLSLTYPEVGQLVEVVIGVMMGVMMIIRVQRLSKGLWTKDRALFAKTLVQWETAGKEQQ